MLYLAIVSALLQAAAPTEAPEEEFGRIEFSRQSSRQSLESIQIFIFEEDERVRYLADIGSGGSRKLTLEAPPGTHKFVVVVQAGNGGVSSGARSDVTRRRRPNVTLEVKAGHETKVSIGSSSDAARSQGDPSAVVDSPFSTLDPEGSQFQTRIRVGKPKKLKKD